MTTGSTRLGVRTAAGSAAYWALVGALASFGVAGVMTIGIFFLAAAATLALLAALLKISTRGWPGMFIGVAFTPFYIAVLNRSGPGQICTRTATTISCSEQTNPWWWVAAGVALVAIGAILLLRRRRPTPVLADPPYPGASNPNGTTQG